MKLTEADKLSALWQKLEPYLEERISTLRAQNDGELDQLATARLRGRLAELKLILSLRNADSVQAEADS